MDGGVLAWAAMWGGTRLRIMWRVGGAEIAAEIPAEGAWLLHDYIAANMKRPANSVPAEPSLTDAELEQLRKLLGGAE